MLFLTNQDEFVYDNGLMVLYFYTNWMPFHKKMLVMIDKIQSKYSDIKFIAIDADYFKSLCLRFEIKSVPTVVIFKDQKEYNRIIGLPLTSAFKSVFHDICNINYCKEVSNGKKAK